MRVLFPLKLDREGYSVSIVHRKIAENAKGVKIFAFKENSSTSIANVHLIPSFRNKYLDALWIDLYYLCNWWRFDVVHMVPNIALLPMFLLARLLRRKMVYTFHETVDETLKRGFVERSVLLAFAKGASKTTCISDFCGKSALKVGLSPVRIYHGADSSFYPDRNIDFLKSEFRIKNKLPCALYVGALRKGKGADVFLNLAKRISKVNFLLVGQGAEYESLKERIKSLKNVYYKPSVSRDKLRVVYSSCDVLVFPSRIDAFGLVVLESVLCGTPVVALKAASLPEVLVKGAGVLCQDEKAMELAVRRIVKNKQKVAPSVIQAVKNRFNWRKIAQQYVEVYDEA